MPDTVRSRADVTVVIAADGGEPGLAAAVRQVVWTLDDLAEDAPPGSARADVVRLRGHRLGGELVLVVRDVAALPAELRGDHPRVRVVAAPGSGGGRARNLGVAAARGRYLLFTTPDVRVPRGWAAAMTAPLRAGHADLVAGAVHRAEGHTASGAAAGAAPARSVADPPPPGAFPAESCGATRAVLEAVGFDEALGTGRYPDVAAAFRLDAVGAGFREQSVGGVRADVDRNGCGGRRAQLARARGQGRVEAYLDRHLRDRRTGAPVALLRALGAALVVAARSLRFAPVAALLPAHAAFARHRETLRLRAAPYRDRPRSAAGDAPGGAGAPRAADPVALVPRESVPPGMLPLPPAPDRDEDRDEDRDDDRVRGAGPGRPGARQDAGAVRGSVHAFWTPARTRAAVARARTAGERPARRGAPQGGARRNAS